ncbi:hypothetical protein COD86_18360 [Bacillus cereus]|nr:hypothetical protein COD14_16940 [Bacillus cereus]PGV93409.1 hypothetical protein COD86_18360 [Bacillus cereus]
MYNEIQKELRGEGEIDEGLQEWVGNFDLEDVNDYVEICESCADIKLLIQLAYEKSCTSNN